MKTSLLSAIFSAIALIAFDATAAPLPSYLPHAPITIDWTINQQVLSHTNVYAGNGKTNITGTAGAGKTTNVLQIYRSTFKTLTYSSASILDLLSNSLNTNFPAHTKLVWAGGSLFVTDHTGTNVIVDITKVLTVSVPDQVDSALQTTVQTYKKTGTNSTSSSTGSGNQVILVKYDDSALTAGDGTKTTFTFVGVSAYTESGSSAISIHDIETGSEAESFALHGVGYGTIRDQPSVIQGTIIGSPSGSFSIDIGILP